MCRVFEEITKKQSTKGWLRPFCNPPCMFARLPPLGPCNGPCTLTVHFSRQVRTILKVFRFSFPVPVVGPSKRTNAVLILGDPGAASRNYRMFDLIVNFHREHSIVPTSSSCSYSEGRGCLRNCPRMPSFLLHPSGRKNVLRKLLRIACVCLRLFVSFCESSDWDWMKYTRCDRLLLVKALFLFLLLLFFRHLKITLDSEQPMLE